ncbi:OLC1v1035460C1 [Oldenlandia corymbosa var. corymbosa]|uniref:OLC1v1035460C1 n=1 Tax=Oldenlandia corymbosa var. corymbosa TaxID=529605 RepID=A0AAV1CTT3_OLDCO|nr:OLC1v1035460C1 [Oldenlandia corymbosa var. corymbosa]
MARPCLVSLLITSLAVTVMVLALVDADCMDDCLVGCSAVGASQMKQCIDDCQKKCGDTGKTEIFESNKMRTVDGNSGVAEPQGIKEHVKCYFIKCAKYKLDKLKYVECRSKC